MDNVLAAHIERFSRRRFLTGGARAAAGIAALSGLEALRPSPAFAQSGSVFNLTFHEDLFSAVTVYDDDDRLRLCRHVYEFDLIPGPGGGIPVTTYRIRQSPPGRFQLQEIVLPSPLGSVDEYRNLLDSDDLGDNMRVAWPPPPPTPPSGDNVAQEILIFTVIRRNNDGRSYHIIDFCSLYAVADRQIEIHVGNETFRYDVGDLAAPGIPAQVTIHTPVPAPVVRPWTKATSPTNPVGALFFFTNATTGAPTHQANWDAVLRANSGCKVEAFIPDSPNLTRTAQATYRIFHANGFSDRTISQATPGWITLIDNVAFGNNLYRVALTNKTGGPLPSQVMAERVRWSC